MSYNTAYAAVCVLIAAFYVGNVLCVLPIGASHTVSNYNGWSSGYNQTNTDSNNYGSTAYSNNNPWSRTGASDYGRSTSYSNNLSSGTVSSSYGRSHSYPNSNPWSTQGYQQTISRSGFSTSTPWPSLGTNRNQQYDSIVDAALPDPQWIINRYNSQNYNYNYDNNNNYNRGSYTNSNPNRRYNNNNQRGPFLGPSSTSTNGQGSERRSGTAVNVRDDELREFSENLLRKDDNNAGRHISVNYQGQTTSRSQNDEAPLPLITVNDPQVYRIQTISKLKPLFDNYILHANVAEDNTPQERNEEDYLLDAVISTPVMEYTRDFLIQKGVIGRNPSDFKNILKEIWFTMYSRAGGKVGSSGFEHVFVAEVKHNQVSGLHNWIYFNEEEKKNKANYLGYMRKIDLGDKGGILKLHFKYDGIDKPVASMFIGTSPELEMALYSTCFLLRADRICPLKLDGNRFIIRTFTYRYRGKNLIGSAFPEI